MVKHNKLTPIGLNSTTFEVDLSHPWNPGITRSIRPAPVLKCFSFRHQQLKFIHGKPALHTRSYISFLLGAFEVVNCWVNGVLGVGAGKHIQESILQKSHFSKKFPRWVQLSTATSSPTHSSKQKVESYRGGGLGGRQVFVKLSKHPS